MTVVLRPTRACKQCNQLVTLGHASVEWVMGRYFTPDTVLRARRYVDKHSEVGHEIVSNTLKTIITVEKQGS